LGLFLFSQSEAGRTQIAAQIGFVTTGGWNHPPEYRTKISAGEAITHELINIAHTRQGAQFSLGKANLTHHPDLASGLEK
jgi:hypothetical protein